MCLPGRGCAGCSHARPARSPSQARPSRAVPAAPGSGDSDTAPSPRLSFGASQHKPPAQNVRPPHPAFCSGGSFSSSFSSNSAKAQILQWGGGSGWRGGWARTRIFQGGRNGNTQNEMNLPPVREGSLGGGASPPPVAASLLSSSQLPIVRTLQGSGTSPKERRLGPSISGGYLPFSHTVQQRALGACEGTRAHTRAHTH